MTVYVALDAVRAGRLTMDTPLVVSARAASQAPSKMGFRPGTEVTLDNALKMLMVKSPNDTAVTVAEGVSGSVEAFAAEMNAEAQKIGLHELHFVNPNGLHNPEHYSSARDMAMIARALLRDFPERAGLFDIGELQLGSQIIRNHNGLLGRYPGADGMKTGFTCPAGFNVVATANHYGRRLITVVLFDQEDRLAHVWMEHAVADKTAAIADQHSDLPQLPRKLHAGRDHRLAGFFPSDNLEQAHHIRGAEKMSADHEFRPGCAGGDFVNVQGGCVAGENRSGLAQSIEFGKDLASSAPCPRTPLRPPCQLSRILHR